MNDEIDAMERALLEDKHWSLAGEASGKCFEECAQMPRTRVSEVAWLRASRPSSLAWESVCSIRTSRGPCWPLQK